MRARILGFGLAALVGCGKDDESAPPPTVGTIEISPSSPTLPAGATLQLAATLKDADGNVLSSRTVTWASTVPGVADVSTGGLLGAHAAGQATISATADGVSGTTAVTVLTSVVSVVVAPTPAAVAPTRVVQLTAVLRDEAGDILADRAIAWSSSAPAIATVDADGLVTGVTAGTATITATAEGVLGNSVVVVDPAAAVATVEVAPPAVIVSQHGTVQLTATARNAANEVLLGHPVQWASGDDGKVSISSTGLVEGLAVGGPITVTAAAEGIFGTALVTITAPAVASVTLTPGDLTFVPGGALHFVAQVRDISGNILTDRTVAWSSSAPSVVSIGTALPFDPDAGYPVTVTGLSEGSSTLTATVDGVSGDATLTVQRVSFASVSVGHTLTCALDTGGRAFCWGTGGTGELGAGDIPGLDGNQDAPLLAQPSLVFSAVSVGGGSPCGLAVSGEGWCWGAALFGGLGVDPLPGACNPNLPLTPCSTQAVTVAGGLAFTRLTAGGTDTCALTSGGAAYCWGANHWGQIGNAASSICASYPCNLTPTQVVGGHLFEEIAVGLLHACGRIADGSVYCWGKNTDGQLGNPAAGESSGTPILVAGGIAFAHVTAGGNHTCGLDGNGTAYCWGSNIFGELGTGSSSQSAGSPQAVFGGITFTSITASIYTTCGTASSGARCWGSGDYGTLGTGSLSSSSIPALVSGGHDFTTLSAGSYRTCGITGGGRLLCWPAGDVLTPVEVIGQL